jgi:uncharacterized protein (TIGR02453 family)
VGFSGWPLEAVEFFTGLQADNTKAYWDAHKVLYEASVRTPMAELLGELCAEFGPGRIARPYRDIRFRADKSPYKTEIYASLERGGYVRFGADGLTAATGYFMMSAGQLDRYRRAVDREADGVELAQVVARLRKEGLEVGGGQALRTAPRGYPADHPRIELLRYKGLICWRHWPVAPWLHTAEAKDQVAGVLRVAAPLHRWLDQHVGPIPPDQPRAKS